MKSIGGYFELEMQVKECFHKEAIALNTGRNALEYLLLANRYTRIYLPYYSCEALLEPIRKCNISYTFYPINMNLEPEFDHSQVKDSEAFLYINYFGLKDPYLRTLTTLNANVIVDNVQSFYSLPIPRVDTFYSARKFFGVPDGAYLYSNKGMTQSFETGTSASRIEHLLTRIEASPEEGYPSFQQNENRLMNLPVQWMSNLTKQLLASIDYEAAASARKANFMHLHQHLSRQNKLPIEWDQQQVPMTYPFLTTSEALKKFLQSHRVYCPTYWPGVAAHKRPSSIEETLLTNLVCLPIDQRYSLDDMNTIIHLIQSI
jgi:hypothetical protein